MLDFVSVAIGSGGPPRCTRCRGERPAPSYLPESGAAAALSHAAESWPGGPGPNVELAGPEPFGHPALPALVAAAVQAGVVRLRLDTDACALGSHGNAAGSISAGVRHIRFTLLGGTPGLHDVLVGEQGAFEGTLEGVRTFLSTAAGMDADVCVTCVVPACRHDVGDLVATVGAAVQAGARAVTLVVDDAGLDLGGAAPSIMAACDTGVVNGVWVDVEGLPFCLLPGYDLHVADVVRERTGAKAPACGGCALDPWCAGGPADATADTLCALAPPPDAARLASAVARARQGVRV